MLDEFFRHGKVSCPHVYVLICIARASSWCTIFFTAWWSGAFHLLKTAFFTSSGELKTPVFTTILMQRSRKVPPNTSSSDLTIRYLSMCNCLPSFRSIRNLSCFKVFGTMTAVSFWRNNSTSHWVECLKLYMCKVRMNIHYSRFYFATDKHESTGYWRFTHHCGAFRVTSDKWSVLVAPLRFHLYV